MSTPNFQAPPGFACLSKMHFKPMEVLTMSSPSARTKAKLEMSNEQRCLTHTGPKCGLKYLKVLTRCLATMKTELME